MPYLYILPQNFQNVKYLTNLIIETYNFDSQLLKNTHPDILIINSDLIGIEQIKQAIQFASVRPTQASQKLIIIGPFDNANVQAQNAFLKTLEESPKYVNIFLFAYNQSKILDTIKSRCTTIFLNPQTSHNINNITINKLLDLLDNKNNLSKLQFIELLNYTQNLITNSKKLNIKQKNSLLKQLLDLHKSINYNLPLSTATKILYIMYKFNNLK